MYTHARDQASRPTAIHTTIYPTSQYNFATPSGSGFTYDATVYPPIRSSPLSIPKTSSSSLAAALVPAPESDYNISSASPSQVMERADEQFNPLAFANLCADSSAGDAAFQVNTAGRFSNSVARQFSDSSVALRAQRQMYHDENGQNQSQSQLVYAQTNVSLTSPSSYDQSHQMNTYMRSDVQQWSNDVTFPGYPTSLSLSSVSSTVAGSSQYPIIPNDHTFNAVDNSDRTLNAYGNGDGVELWPYAQPSNSFNAPEEMYLGFNQSNISPVAGRSSWFSSPLASQDRIPTDPNTPFLDSSLIEQGFGSSSASQGRSNLRLSVVEAGSSSVGGDHSHGPRDNPSRPIHHALEENSIANVREQYQPSASRIGESVSIDHFSQDLCSKIFNPYVLFLQIALPTNRIHKSLAHADSRQSVPPSLQPTLPRSHSAQSSPKVASGLQRSSGLHQLEGHNVLMPPPPIPPRAQTSAPARPESNRPSQGSLPRRHTVAAPPGCDNVDGSSNPSPPPLLTTASARPSSAASESSSPSSLRNEAPEERPTTPRLATLTSNDAQWAQAQDLNRCSLSESYRLSHGRDPPAKMRIKQSSALERSVINDAALFCSPIEKGPQADRAPDVGGSSAGEPARKATVLYGEPASASPEEMSDKEFFSQLPVESWVAARSGFEIGQRTAALKPHLGTTSLVSPISPAITDELITPGDASVPSVRRPQVNYAYETPANPEAVAGPPSSSMKNVISVMRHDGHLFTHVSGLGGTFVEAYDGRSYLTDDSEQDPVHLPPCPPGARSGDHPALETVLPHPLMKRGQVWHDLINPRSKSQTLEECPDQQEDVVNDSHRDSPDKLEDADPAEERAILKKLEAAGIKEEEQGEGWGFVEGGSHGPHLSLNGKDNGGPGPKQSQRLKLSTEKKTPPKMACHFCRNRKIACGASKCGDPTICNQCERRNIRCIFPTMSRRGMRTRVPRSAHTVDGTDEADKDSADCNEAAAQTDHRSENPSSAVGAKKTGKSKRPYEKSAKDKEAMKGKGRGRRRRKTGSSAEQQDSSVQMDETQEAVSNAQASYLDMPIDRSSGHDDPLASIAAEMQWPQQQGGPLATDSSVQFETPVSTVFSAPSTSSLSDAFHFPSSAFENSFPTSMSGDDYALPVDPPPGPFTTSPLQRRGQSNPTMRP
ncbi:hypothetical protein ACEPAG_7641 [Sanghuangporus baumii]